MSLSERIIDCIDQYLENYDVILEDLSYKSKSAIEGSLRIYAKSQKIGHILYAIDKQSKNLHINSIYVPKSKYKPSIKFTKILLVYLLDKYSRHIETSTLLYRKGQEFCLLCIYQELGYEPYTYLKKCDLSPKDKNTCILCICQKNTDKLDGIDMSQLYVDMNANLPNLKRIVKELFNEL